MKILYNLTKHTPAILLVLFCILAFGLFAAPVAVDVLFKQSLGTVYTFTTVKSISVQASNVAGGLILLTVLGLELAALCIVLNTVKGLNKTATFLDLSAGDIATGIIAIFYITAFILTRLIWTEVAKINVDFEFFKEGACTITLSVFESIFFAVTIAAIIGKAIMERKFPDFACTNEKNTVQQNCKILLNFGYFVGAAFLFAVLGIFALSYSITPIKTSTGNVYVNIFSTDNSYYFLMSFYFAVIAATLISSIYLLVKIIQNKLNYRKVRITAGLASSFLNIIYGIMFIVNIINESEGYVVGSGPIALIVFGALNLLCSIIFLLVKRQFFNRHKGELTEFIYSRY